MANLVEWIMKIRDHATGDLRRIGANADGTFIRMGFSAARISNRINDLNKDIDALTRSRNMNINISDIRRANREIEALEQRRDRLENSGRTRGGGMFAKGLIFGGIAAAGYLGGQAIKNGMDRQMAGTSFEVMAGKKDGDHLHKNLIGFATDTIYGNEVFGEAKEMLGFGVAAKNIMPSMKMIGDIAMGDVEHMKSLTLGFSEAAAAGKVTGREMLIMTDAGFNPLNALSAKTGRSMADLRKDMEKGKVTFKDLALAMDYATGPMGRYYKGMERIGNTPTGKIKAFMGALDTLSGTIGVELLPMLAVGVGVLNWLGDHTGILYGIAAGIGAMSIAWEVYTAWTKKAAIWQAITAAIAFWPIAVIGILVAAIVWLVRSFDGWGKSLGALWKINKLVLSMIGIAFKENFQEWFYYFDLFYLKAKSVFEYVGKLISNVVQAMKLALTGDFAGAKNMLTAHITTSADKDIEALKKERSGQRSANAASILNDAKQIGQQWKNVGLTWHKGAAKDKSVDWQSQLFNPKGMSSGSGTPGGLEDNAKGITGGGVRNLTINIAKQGIDQITIHAATLKEGKAEIQNLFIDMFNQIVNSGNALVAH